METPLRKFAAYTVVRELGRGSFAIVYLVQNARGQKYALKILKMSLNRDQARILSREAQILKRLFHPSIVKVSDFIEYRGEHAILLEFADGENLEELITRRRKLPFRDILNISYQICSALVYAHSQGVIHRDIKPQNVIITKDFEVKLTDLGLASAATESIATLSISPNNPIGTPHYISPEQARGNRGDARSDIYSLGVLMYQMITGQTPYKGDTYFAIMNRHISDSETPTPLSRLRTDTPQELERLVEKAMEKKPTDRFQNAAEMCQALRDVAEQLHIQIDERKKEHFLPVTSITLALFGAVSAALWFAFQPGFEPLGVLIASLTPCALLLIGKLRRQYKTILDYSVAIAIGVIFLVGSGITFASNGQIPGPARETVVATLASSTTEPIVVDASVEIPTTLIVTPTQQIDSTATAAAATNIAEFITNTAISANATQTIQSLTLVETEVAQVTASAFAAESLTQTTLSQRNTAVALQPTTPAPTVAPAPPTPLPTIQPTRSSFIPTPTTIDVNALCQGTVFLEDSFNNDDNWSVGETRYTGAQARTYITEDDRLAVEIFQDGNVGFFHTVKSGQTGSIDNFCLSVDFEIRTPNTGIVVLFRRNQANDLDYYYFSLRQDGRMQLSQRQNGRWASENRPYFQPIRTEVLSDFTQYNLKIVVDGGNFQFFVNDILTASGSDSDIPQGFINLGIVTSESPTQYVVAFDNFRLLRK